MRNDVYCGLASKKESKKKFLKLELEHHKKQEKKLTKKINDIESKLSMMG